MYIGQDSLSATAENLTPQTVRTRISRAAKSGFLPDFLCYIGSSFSWQNPAFGNYQSLAKFVNLGIDLIRG
jgi:hypothetical protein